MTGTLARRMLAMAWLVSGFAAAGGGKPLLQVTTNSGDVMGVRVGDTWQWRAIPFAQPPVGPLRWVRAQTPPASWTGVRDGSGFAPVCIQGGDNGGTQGSEDCLYLNVTTPVCADASGNPALCSGLPVVVDIFGGGNLGGGPIKDTSPFVRNGVIVVTMNYRVGMIGWLAHPELSAEGGGSSSNYGLWDQKAAFEWVQSNIAAFGGNASNVTLSGFSSGAGDGLALVVSPLTRHGLFRQAELHSFEIFQSTGINQDLPSAEQGGIDFAASLGCSDIACMRALPADVIVENFSDTPQAIIDGVFLPAGETELARQFGTVPLVVTNSAREEGWQILFTPPMTVPEFTLNLADLAGSPHLGILRGLYPAATDDERALALVNIYLDIKYTCASRALLLATGAPTWRWVFSHLLENGGWPAEWGALHGSDMAVMWEGGYPRAPDEDVMAFQMQRYMTNFAKTGNPNEAGLPPWPAFTPSAQEFLEFADGGAAAGAGYHARQCDAIDPLVGYVFQKCGAVCRTLFRGRDRFHEQWTPGIAKLFGQ